MSRLTGCLKVSQHLAGHLFVDSRRMGGRPVNAQERSGRFVMAALAPGRARSAAFSPTERREPVGRRAPVLGRLADVIEELGLGGFAEECATVPLQGGECHVGPDLHLPGRVVVQDPPCVPVIEADRAEWFVLRRVGGVS